MEAGARLGISNKLRSQEILPGHGDTGACADLATTCGGWATLIIRPDKLDKLPPSVINALVL